MEHGWQGHGKCIGIGMAWVYRNTIIWRLGQRHHPNVKNTLVAFMVELEEFGLEILHLTESPSGICIMIDLHLARGYRKGGDGTSHDRGTFSYHS